MPKNPKKIYDERGQFIDDELVRLEKAVTALQKEILEVLVIDYATEFAGGLSLTPENLKKLYELTPIFEELAGLNNALETKVASNLLKLTEYSADYFSELGMKVSGIKKQIGTIYDAIGITEKGVMVKGGYLSKLFQTTNTVFQQSVSDYVLESIASEKPYQEFVRGFRELIKGTPETEGKLLKYYKQYTNDLYSKVARITDTYYANELGLTYFVYDGTAIPTSRPFCAGGDDKYLGKIPSKIGKVFTKDDLKSWNDLMWEGKDKESTVEVSLGGYGCRHMARFVDDSYAEELLNKQTNE